MILRMFNNIFNLKDRKIRNELFQFCECTDLDQCILILKEKLKKSNQVKMYDSIYNDFIISRKIYDCHTSIQNLNIPVKLMIFCMYYRHLLFPSKFNCIKLSEGKMDWLLTLFNKRYSSFSFLFVSFQLSRLYEEKVFDGTPPDLSSYNSHNELFDCYRIIGSPYIDQIDDFKIPAIRFCFLYILLHKAGNSSYESIVSFLVDDEKYSKIPLSFKFWMEGNEAHGGEYKHAPDFLFHDYEHLDTILYNISKYNVQEIKKNLNSKIVVIYAFTYLFDTECRNTYFFENFEQNFRDVVKRIDTQDCHYLFSYLMKSNDDSELILKYNEFKEKYDILAKEHREIVDKEHTVEEWREIMDKIEPLCFEFFDFFCNGVSF